MNTSVYDSKHTGIKVIIICFINDPFDIPGGKRIGGGHLVLSELGEYLVSAGVDVTFITRLNDKNKETYKELGPMCRILRLSVGAPVEMPPSEVGNLLDELEAATQMVLEHTDIDVVHSQYWISGEVIRRIKEKRSFKHIHYMLSFGRQKVARGEQKNSTDNLREQCEVKVFNSVDCIIAQCPSEAADLKLFYPEISHKRIAIIPHGVDSYVFSPRI
jgi:hypothetical protein